MNCKETLNKFLPAYKHYYNVTTCGENETFDAYAEFHSHEKQFFLSKSATISESESNEYVFFVSDEMLTADTLKNLSNEAWSTGIKKVEPHKDHKSSDVVLIIFTNSVSKELNSQIKKCKFYKSYKHTFFGWSHFRLAVIELSSGKIFTNQQGKSLKSTLTNIYKSIMKGDI